MTVEQLIHEYSVLSRAHRVRMIVSLIHNVTVLARAETYVVGSEDISDPPKLRGFNELIHQISGYLAHVLDESEHTYSDQHFFELLQLHAEELDCRRGMLDAMERSLRVQQSRRTTPARAGTAG